MVRIKKLSEKLQQKSNLLIAITGLVLLVSLVLVYLLPHNKITILIACAACGFMNILQGLKYLNDAKKKTTGWSVIMLGIIVIVVGIVIVTI